MKLRVLVVLLFVCTLSQAQVKVACIGDSVTYGAGIEDRDHDSYPVRLQGMLGSGYEVRNFGHNGATLLRKGHKPYVSFPEYTAAREFAPDIAIIHLGLNDTDPRNWPDWSEEFIGDYHYLIDSFREVNPSVRVFICRMTPIFHGHARFLSGTRDWHKQIQDAIEQVAATTAGVGLIDLYSPLISRPDLFADNLHPSPEGAEIIAKTVYSALTGDFGGLQLSPMYTDNMVLQRDKPVIIRGIANAGEKVIVELKNKNKKLAKSSSVAGFDGFWEVQLPAMSQGGPYTLNIGDKTFNNVWVGEVWLCAGQSNMEFKLKACSTAAEDLGQASSQSRLHLFQMEERWLTNNKSWSEDALDQVNKLKYFQPDGWKECSEQEASNFSAIAYHFGRALADSLECHVGLISCAVGGSTTESWCDPEVLRWDYPQVLYNWTKGDYGQAWARGRALVNIKNAKKPTQRHPYFPSYNFDAGIRAIDHFPVKGVVWYQGESNTHNRELYDTLFKLAVKSWRNYWGEPLPVQLIQLSGIETRPSWPAFRDLQRRHAEDMENVYLTVCSDQGHPTDVHPKNKKVVGERVCQSALYNVYGFNNVVPCGPQVKEAVVMKDGSVRISFDFAVGMSVSSGFEIAGEDGLFYPANAIVKDSDIFVSSPSVTAPSVVRYGWQPNPVSADLKNAAGMPASTFQLKVRLL